MTAMFSALSAMSATLPTTIVKATIVLGGAGIIALALHRASAAARHLVWLLSLASCVILAVAAPAVPRIAVAVPAIQERGVERARPTAAPVRTRRASPTVVAAPGAIAIGEAPMEIVVPAVASAPDTSTRLVERLPFALLAAWAIGFVLVIGRARLGHARLASIVGDAQRMISSEWQTAIRDASADVGITREVEVFESDEITSPMTSGFLNPVIIVPMEARGWNAERRHIVLVHELAHVARFDYVAQLVATAACAVFWFHPLAWLAAARLRAEAEHSADDHVLNAGTVGVTYATHLLEIAQRHGGDLTPAPAVGMVRSSRLEGRFRALLDSTRSRAAVPARFQTLAASLTLCAMLPLAGVQPVATRRSFAPIAAYVPGTAQTVAIAVAEPAAIVTRERITTRAVAIPFVRTADSVFEETIEASPGGRLTLDLRSGGALVIHGWDEPRVRVVGRLSGRDWRDTRVSLERVSGGLRLRSEMASLRENWSTSHEFELWVPRHTNIQLSSAGGSLAINDLSGEFSGHTGGGGITIEGATGSAALSTGGGEVSVANSRLSGTVTTGGGQLTITNVTGGLRGSSGSGSVIASNVDGASTVRGGVGYGVSTAGGFGGVTAISGGTGIRTNVISGTVGTTTTRSIGGDDRSYATSSGGALAISKDGGEIVIDRAPNGAMLHTGGGRIVVGSSDRGLSANTGGGDIELENVAGDATATTGSGDVRISVVNSFRTDHRIDVESGTGRVVIEVPANLDARIELESAYTDNSNRRTTISSDFALEKSETDRWDGSVGTPRKYVRAVGVLGSGRGLIRVRTVNGDVVLRRVSR